ncbi:flagellar hook-length control protein FliK [Maridesulfovibrio ferrireducens]|uniref:Flagellar hook-length control protein FliK n=1 Tax=Maridesulfovibrio ferrireducens TaxID=246191 RepID=A0A1G9J724_9BACT|nr:flagellar hook-length control protein FliK [Maridesulfovibrio ferrireducens]SDL33045.1 flagellar hook-length control protein FliK [Maridesulfovibrio ferrireducens]
MKILPHLDQSTQNLEITTDRTPLLEDSYRSSMFDDFLYSSNQAGFESIYQPVQEAVADIRSSYDDVSYNDELQSASEYIDETAREISIQSVEEQPQELQVSREDWNEIKEELTEYGIDKKDIADLEEKVMSKGGLTYGELVSELTGMMQSVKGFNLDPVQQQNMHSIFSKLGFAPDEAKAMLVSISKGNMGDVLEKMQAKLAALSDSQSLQLSEEETKTLNSLFKLSGENSAKVAQLLTKDGATVGLIKQGFSVLKDALAEQSAAQDAKDLKLVKTVSFSLQSAMDKASDQTPDTVRMASAKVISDSLGIGKDISDSSKPAMHGEAGDSVMSKNSNDNSTLKQNGNNALNSENNSGSGLGNQTKGGFEDNPQNNPQNNSAANDSKYTAKHWLENILSDSNDVNTWNDFFGKLSDASLSKGESSILGEGFGGGAMGALKNAAHATQSGKTTGMWEKTARSNILEQVQQGAFKNLGQGKSQITLTLNPLDLGTVNVMIQVKNKEVQATIRAENPETAKVIAEQLETVKLALEEQGLKVDKLEVQTGIADRETQSSWNGAQDHNSAHYQEMMAGMKKRWQALRNGGTSLAQDMQNIEHTATISQSGLHIVA